MSSREPTERPRRLAEVPKSGAPRMSVIRLKGGEKITGVILSKFFSGFAIHWNASIHRSQPCKGKENGCEGCAAELPEKSVWYLHVHTAERGHSFLEVTPHAADNFINTLAPGESLRGLRFNAHRSRSDNGRLILSIDPYAPRVESLPPAVDPESTLAALWNWGRP